MSMNGEYLRVTPAELDRALKDPEWAHGLAEEAMDAAQEHERVPSDARHFTTEQTWHLLDFLLRRATFPVDIVHGEEPLPEAEDWGYDPPGYLPPARVQAAAEALRELPYDRLIRNVDPSELTRAEVYPLIWDSPDSLEWARDVFLDLTAFLGAAAEAGDGMLLWID
ncbi:YfbM family protein [Streptomyces sp. NPDC059874]|uniref:YfbM family protein n=1 Tax=Streptomyces sp. NPDC059874 TaxID=3346983 RepID=UPI0036488782